MYDEKSMQEDKGILTGLLSLMLLAGLAAAAVVLYLLLRQEQIFLRLASIVLLVFAAAAVIVMASALVSILVLYSGRGDTAAAGRIVLGALNRMLIPAFVFGKLVGLSRERIQRAYAGINNRVVMANRHRFKPEEVLVLLPHCLQDSGCKHRITVEVYNCKECGKCTVADIVKLGKETGVNIKMVPGGTLARKIIEETRPGAVVAVACENDLCSGIRDTGLLPVIGILNERPRGPCRDTRVDVKKVRSAVKFFTDGRY
jgi:hypothetical protein